MRILVINGGSSSIKVSIFEMGTGEPSLVPSLVYDNETTHGESIEQVLAGIPVEPGVDVVGYRVVHPGPKIAGHVRITPAVMKQLKEAVAFAPLHDPLIVGMIEAGQSRYPDVAHYACFDTVFHQTMPAAATTYPLPLALRDQGVHRYGFHGLSCESVVYQLRAVAGLALPKRLIVAHLGGGCSVTAIVDGKSVDTSMGLTPTGGVVMGSRPGDLDPGLLFYLLRQPGATVDSVEKMVNHEAGLKALGGTPDMKALRASKAAEAQQAITIFVQSVRRAIGGMVALYGMDALVFTGGIGEHDPKTRWALGNGLRGTGLEEPQIDFAANELSAKGLRQISDEDALYRVFVVPAEEDLMIALHVARMSAKDL